MSFKSFILINYRFITPTQLIHRLILKTQASYIIKMVLNSIWQEIYGMLTYFTLQLFANMTAVFCKLLFSQTSQIFRFWIIFSESYFFSSELYFSSKSYGTILYFTCITNGRYQKSFMLKNGAFFTYCRLLFFWKKKEKKKKPKSLIFFSSIYI